MRILPIALTLALLFPIPVPAAAAAPAARADPASAGVRRGLPGDRGADARHRLPVRELGRPGPALPVLRPGRRRPRRRGLRRPARRRPGSRCWSRAWTPRSRLRPRARRRRPAGPGVQARTLYEQLSKRSRGVAVVAWLGYDPPEGIGLAAATQGRARAGATALTAFVQDLMRQRPGATVTLIGHSYGALVVGLAAPDLPEVHDLIALGAPGMGAGPGRRPGRRPGLDALAPDRLDPPDPAGAAARPGPRPPARRRTASARPRCPPPAWPGTTTTWSRAAPPSVRSVTSSCRVVLATTRRGAFLNLVLRGTVLDGPLAGNDSGR